MQNVTFARRHRHVTVEKTTVFPANWTGSVANDIAEAASKAGALKEIKRGSIADKGRATGDAGEA